jgi:hypothetical protein
VQCTPPSARSQCRGKLPHLASPPFAIELDHVLLISAASTLHRWASFTIEPLWASALMCRGPLPWRNPLEPSSTTRSPEAAIFFFTIHRWERLLVAGLLYPFSDPDDASTSFARPPWCSPTPPRRTAGHWTPASPSFPSATHAPPRKANQGEPSRIWAQRDNVPSLFPGVSWAGHLVAHWE